MERQSAISVSLICGLSAALLLADTAYGQRPARPAVPGRPAAAPGAPGGREEDPVRARRITGLGASAKIRTPEYRSSIARGAKTPKDWVAVGVTYDTKPEWLDEVMIRYYALSYKVERGRKMYALYKCTVRCLDVEEGRSHQSVAYLRPAALERFGELVAVAAEIVVGGKVADEISEESVTLPEKWWTNPDVTESEMLTVRNGYLLERTRSPFAFINIGEYEYEPY